MLGWPDGVLSLQPYDFTVVHCRGIDNYNADVLSWYYSSDKNDSSPKNPVMFNQVKYGQTSLTPEKGGGVSERVTSLDNWHNLSWELVSVNNLY